LKRLLIGWLLGVSLVGAATSGLVFRSVQDQPVTLAQLSARSRSGLVCCVLWCSRCGSCRNLEPKLIQLWKDMQGKATVVAVDRTIHDDANSIVAYREKHGLPVEVFRDPVGGLADQFRINVTTTSVVFDAGLKPRYVGRFDQARAALDQLLAGQDVLTPVTEFEGCPILR
jgi:hypothetical protein